MSWFVGDANGERGFKGGENGVSKEVRMDRDWFAKGVFVMSDAEVKEITDLSFWEWVLRAVAHL